MIDIAFLKSQFRTAYQLAKSVGISEMTAHRLWKSRKANLETIVTIADYLNCSLDLLITRKEKV